MSELFKKLNLGNREQIVVLNAPASFELELARLQAVTIHHDLESVRETDFVLAFVTRKSEIDELAPKVILRTKGDAILWFAYPKATSKQFKCDFNRDNGWDQLKKRGFETVRAIAIDQDWTALRFRRREFIKKRT